MDFRGLVGLALAAPVWLGCGARAADAAASDVHGVDAAQSRQPSDESDATVGSPRPRPDVATAPEASAWLAPADVDGAPECAVVLDSSAVIEMDSGVACTNVDPSNYDRSCETAADCTLMPSGTVCSDNCSRVCGTRAVSLRGAACAREQLAQIGPLLVDCRVVNCPAAPVPRCVHGKCVGQ
jgi:hypothetical protein